MKLRTIAFRNLMRRKAKALFILVGLLIGIASVVAFVSLVEALTKEINHKMEKYGANILIVPEDGKPLLNLWRDLPRGSFL